MADTVKLLFVGILGLFAWRYFSVKQASASTSTPNVITGQMTGIAGVVSGATQAAAGANLPPSLPSVKLPSLPSLPSFGNVQLGIAPASPPASTTSSIITTPSTLGGFVGGIYMQPSTSPTVPVNYPFITQPMKLLYQTTPAYLGYGKGG